MKIYKIFFLNISLCFLFLLCIFNTKIYAISSVNDIFQNSNSTDRLEILNPVSHPKTGNIWEIQFTTQGVDDLAISLEDKETLDDIEYRGLYCNGFKQYYPLVLTETISYLRDYNCNGTSSLRYLVNKAGNHTVGIQFGEEKEIAHNSGIFQWAKRLGNSDTGDNAYSVTTDSSNNIIVTGKVNGNTDLNGDGDFTDGGGESSTGYGSYDIFMSVFNPSGTHLWSKRLGGINEDIGYSVTTDSLNNIIVTGRVNGNANADLNGDGDSDDGGAETSTWWGYFDIFISVFESNGTHKWAKRLGGTGNDEGYALITDSSNNIIVTGYVSYNADLNGDGDSTDGGAEDGGGYYGYQDIFISVFNSSGIHQWAKRLGGTNNDIGYSVTTDSSRNIIVTGKVKGNADLNGDGDSTDGGPESNSGYGNDDIIISIFNSSGVHQWSKRLGGLSNDCGYSVTTDSLDNIILTGNVDNNVDLNGDGDYIDGGGESTTGYWNYDIFISVFSSSGTFQWSKRLGGTGIDYGYSVTTDSSKNVVVTGVTTNNADLNGDSDSTDSGPESANNYGYYDIFISVFNPSGTFLWAKRLGTINFDYGQSITIDSLSNILITGSVNGNADLNGDGDSTDGGAESNTGYGASDIFISVFAPDTLPSVLISSSPTSTSTVNDPTLTIALTLDDSGDCRLSLSDETYDDMSDDVDCSGDGTTTISCTTPDLGEDGIKDIYISCKDTSGNKSTSATNFDLEYTLDRVLPTPSSFAPSFDSTINTNFPTITFSLDENGDCRAGASDESYADMGDNVDCSGDGTQSISCQMSDIGLNGPKTIYISCQDMVPNQDTIESNENLAYTLLETDSPLKNSFSPESFSTIIDPTPTITFETDENATCRLSLTDESYDQMSNDTTCEAEDGIYQSCTSPDLGIFGDKMIYISCTDGNGNKDSVINNTQLEYTFIPTASSIAGPILDFPQTDGTIYAMALNDNESILYVGGEFETIGGVTRYNLAAIDTQTYEVLDWNLFPEGAVQTIEVYDNEIYIGGSFTNIYDYGLDEFIYTGEFAKINMDGTLDTSCMPEIYTDYGATVYAIKATEEYIYVGGSFNAIGETSDISPLIRLNNNSSCTWDEDWAPYWFYDDNYNTATIYTIDTYGSDVYVGGSFTQIYDPYSDETIYTGEFVKINSQGILDTTCSPKVKTYGPVSTVYSIKTTADYIYIGGSFDNIDDESVYNLARFNNTENCTRDSEWMPYEFQDGNYEIGTIYSINFINNMLFIGGGFSRLYNFETYEEISTGEFIKLNSNGILDTEFDPQIITYEEVCECCEGCTVYSSVVGTKNIFVGGSFNMVGQEDVLGLAAFSIDATPPAGNITINLGNTYSVSPTVTLSLSATDSSGVRQMMVCNNSSFTDCNWETYKTTKSWTFDSTYGNKTVYVKYMDNSGNTSDIYSDSIILHTPSARITNIGEITDIPDKTPLTYYFTSQYPVIKGVSQSGSTIYFVYDGKTYTTVADDNGNFSISLTVPMGSNTIQYYSKDVSGNQSLTRTLNLIVGSSYFPNWLLEKLGLITTEQQEETPEQEQEEEDIPDTPENEQEEEDPQGDIQTLQFTDKDGNPLVNAYIEIDGQEYFTNSNGEIRVVGLEEGKSYKIKVDHNGIKYTTEVLGASGVDSSIQVSISEEDISNEIEWKKILIYAGGGLLFIFFLILIFRRRKDKEEENNSLNIH